MYDLCSKNKGDDQPYGYCTADLHIRKTCLCDLYPLTPHFYIVKMGFFYIVKMGFTGVYIFIYFYSKTEILGTC